MPANCKEVTEHTVDLYEVCLFVHWWAGGVEFLAINYIPVVHQSLYSSYLVLFYVYCFKNEIAT
jgi:predicted glycosyl hydrolase (DUF1957 family)